MKYVSDENLPLLELLARLNPNSSKTTLRSWLKEGRVSIDGQVVKLSSTIVQKGQTVTLGARSRYIQGVLRVYYDDHHLVIIEKPAGLLSVSTDFEKGETAHSILKKHYRSYKVIPVHRLDQDTSGVMVFALNQKTADLLKNLFEHHEIERLYTAIVEGPVDPSQGTWKSYLFEDEQYFVHSTPDPERGRLAITHYTLLNATKKYSLLELKLETGRKNQIRVHCKDAGHPVVGDKKYGSTTDPLKRLCLHAHRLAFEHPITKEILSFESPLPKEFSRLI